MHEHQPPPQSRRQPEPQSGVSRYVAAKLKRWQQLPASLVEAMLHTEDYATEQLDHSNPDVRRAAMSILSTHWTPTVAFADKCMEMARTEASRDARKQALRCLGWCYLWTEQADLIRLMVAVVRNEKEPVEIRQAAYSGLLTARDSPADSISVARSKLSDESRFPEDIDWTLLSPLLARAGVEVPNISTIIGSLRRGHQPRRSLGSVIHMHRSLELAQESLHKGDYHLAVLGFTKTLRLWPGAGKAFLHRARAYYCLGEKEKAIADYTRYIELHPKSTDAYSERAAVYESLGRTDLAEKDRRNVESQEERSP